MVAEFSFRETKAAPADATATRSCRRGRTVSQEAAARPAGPAVALMLFI